MAEQKNITLHIQAGDKEISSDQFKIREWTKSDGTQRAIIVVISVLVVAALMLPIPIVHLAAIPIVLLGTPIAGLIAFKLYSKGTDLQGNLVCPACGHARTITRSVSYWPISVQCLACKQHITISRSIDRITN